MGSRWPLQCGVAVSPQLIIMTLALAVSFGAGWLGNGWRYDAQLQKIRADQAQALNTANSAVVQTQKRLDAERDEHASELAQLDAAGTSNLRKMHEENTRLRTCIDRGTCGLRVNVVRRACSAGDLPGAAETSRVDSGDGAELSPDARQAYFALREALGRVEIKLAACQSSLNILTESKP